jgi:outer membrane protein OmpA-like peptidoglycan-associated protein
MQNRVLLAAASLAALLAFTPVDTALAGSHNIIVEGNRTILKPEEDAAVKFLQTARPAQEMDTGGLSRRVKITRGLLKTVLRKKTERRLRRMFKADRAELAARQASAQQPSQQPAQNNTQQADITAQEKAARQLLRESPASDLRTAAIQQRITQARDLIRSGKLTARTEKRLRQLIADDRKVLASRTQTNQVSDAEKRARQHLKEAEAASTLSGAAYRQRIQESRRLFGLDGVSDGTKRRLRQLVQSDRKALAALKEQDQNTDAEKRARDFLATGVAASSLNGQALRKRIRETRELLQEDDISRRTRNRLQALLEDDRAELQKRRQSQTASNDADDQAGDLLSDGRRAEDLNDRQLRRRMRETRDVLQDPQLSQRLSRRLRERLAADRRELRSRIQTRKGRSKDNLGLGIVIGAVGAATIAALLADRRHARDLEGPHLHARVQDTRNALGSNGLSSYDRGLLSDRLAAYRRELRYRLEQRRESRRLELERRRRDNDLEIVLAERSQFAPRDDIAAAEADDDLIESQLVAPPTREVDRRYTVEDFRRNPSLRRYMPAIEVDSINFGFNEHFVREEEVDELERLGSVIERIVAKNPDEVFLIEGHTDAVGSDGYNLTLSYKRADAVKAALLDFFVVSPRNLETVGYGEQFLKIPTPEEEAENRRVSVRRITPLIAAR